MQFFLVWNIKRNRSQFFKEFHCTIITHSVLFTLVAKISLFCLRPVSTSYTYKLLAVVSYSTYCAQLSARAPEYIF